MPYLLDTHALIWLAEGDSQLSTKVTRLFEDVSNQFLISSISYWEISIKRSLGKLKLQASTTEVFDKAV